MAKILIVDDSESVRSQLSKDLTQASHEVIAAIDGVDGLAKLKANNDIRLVICDVNMPNMDGLTMCQNVRTLPNYATVPILMLTTEANEEMKKTAKVLGIRAWIVKPYIAQKLLSAVTALCPKVGA